MACQAKCIVCKIRFDFDGETGVRLSELQCPFCAARLRRTSAKSQLLTCQCHIVGRKILLDTLVGSTRYLAHNVQLIEQEQDQIKGAGLKPALCPLCRSYTLWPEPRQAVNSLSRYKSEYICNPCGQAELLGNWWSEFFPRTLIAKGVLT